MVSRPLPLSHSLYPDSYWDTVPTSGRLQPSRAPLNGCRRNSYRLIPNCSGEMVATPQSYKVQVTVEASLST